jgi:hypothetical protein
MIIMKIHYQRVFIFMFFLILIMFYARCKVNKHYVGIIGDSIQLNESVTSVKQKCDIHYLEDNCPPSTFFEHRYVEALNSSFNFSCFYYFNSDRLDSVTIVITSWDEDMILKSEFQDYIETNLIFRNYHNKKVLSSVNSGNFNKLLYKWN